MTWLAIEAVIALLLLALIVWWTWPRRDKRQTKRDRD
jgi:hypothetical protein